MARLPPKAHDHPTFAEELHHGVHEGGIVLRCRPRGT
jgi:hypothetical protein